MKYIFLFLLTALSFFADAQTKDCDCSGPLSTDLKTIISQKEYSDFKDWLYTYYQKDETTRQDMKNNSGSNWSAGVTAVIKSIPVSLSGGSSSSSSKDLQKYYRLEQSYLRNRYITNEEINELFVGEFSNNQLAAYKACLELCGVSKSGVYFYAGNNTSDEFYIQVTFKSTPSGASITLDDNARFTNMEPIGGLVFKDSLVIKDGQSRTQYFKRLDPAKAASFTFNVEEGLSIPTIELTAKPSVNQQAIPVGTIVASILDYTTFLKVNNLSEMDNANMSVALWIPCDGRKENKSKYSGYSGGNIPDLRGVFLRGINSYGVTFPSVVAVSDAQKNPDRTTAGQFQADGIKKHKHDYEVGNAVNGHNYNTTGGEFFHKTKRVRKTEINDNAEEETRPKNVTVYYYIKIN